MLSLKNANLKKRFLKLLAIGGLHCFLNKKGLRGRMIMRIGALQSPDVGAPSRYLGRLRTTPRKFSRAF